MKMIPFLLCTTALILSGCSSIKTISLSNYSGQISFFVNTSEYYSGDKIMKCKLSDTATLNGYKCISWIWFFENGHIKQFKTACDIKMSNFDIPSNSRIFFNEQNDNKIQYIWLAKDSKINNVECKGGGKISTEFYDNGSLKACFLTKDQTIQGFSCKSSLVDPVYFYSNGKIKILTLSIDSKFGNVDYKKGESLIIDENGLVTRFKR